MNTAVERTGTGRNEYVISTSSTSNLSSQKDLSHIFCTCDNLRMKVGVEVKVGINSSLMYQYS